MRSSVIGPAALILAASLLASHKQRVVPEPTQFVLAKRLYFDFGPPFNYYELYIARQAERGTLLERITLTPPGAACTAAAHVETAVANLEEGIATLLGPANPCGLSEKELRRKTKRCKNCLNFSGADVMLQVSCGNKVRLIPSRILDRDMFGPQGQVPQNISWTMRLLQRMDDAVGPGPENRTLVQALAGGGPLIREPVRTEDLEALAAGRYDALFPGGGDRVSSLYQAAQNAPPPPTVSLTSSTPVAPRVAAMPAYPPIAELAHVEGTVTVRLTVDTTGKVADFALINGPPLLFGALEQRLNTWKFPQGAVTRQVQAEVTFTLHCTK